jgi:hypothetical protein
MEWRSVQDDRPSCSTSGGQSDVGPELTAAALCALPVCKRKSDKELHVRQLQKMLISYSKA